LPPASRGSFKFCRLLIFLLFPNYGTGTTVATMIVMTRMVVVTMIEATNPGTVGMEMVIEIAVEAVAQAHGVGGVPGTLVRVGAVRGAAVLKGPIRVDQSKVFIK